MLPHISYVQPHTEDTRGQRIMTLINLGVNVVGWTLLEGRLLSILRGKLQPTLSKVTTLSLNLVIILDVFLAQMVITRQRFI